MPFVEVDTSGLDALTEVLGEMRNRASDPSPALAAEAEALKEDILQKLRDSSAMPPLSLVTRAINARRGVRSATPLAGLQGTIEATSDRSSVTVVSTHQWAERLHTGGTNARVFGSRSRHTLPARPFMPLTPSGDPMLTDAQVEAFENRILGYIMEGEI